MKIFVAIPAYDGKVSICTARSLFNESKLEPLTGHYLKVTYLPGCSLISHARNILAQEFLDDPHADRMVFVDADVGWDAGLLTKLATYQHDVVAGIYRYKIEEEKYPMGFFTEVGETDLQNGLLTAAAIPMGFTAISRRALVELKEKTPERAYDFIGKRYHAFFENPFRPANGDMPASLIGEDTAFSHLWRSHGGKIWVDPNMDLIHAEGLKEFKGNLHKFMVKHGATETVPA